MSQLLSLIAVNDCTANAIANKGDVAALCTLNYSAIEPTQTPNWEGPNPYDSLTTAQVCLENLE
jgi:hypothetical protein